MWEIAEAVKLEYGVGSRASARVRLGSDPSRGLRMTREDPGCIRVGGVMQRKMDSRLLLAGMTEGRRWMPDN
jgi:hypothetical protein